jgi:hypothetical protein
MAGSGRPGNSQRVVVTRLYADAVAKLPYRTARPEDASASEKARLGVISYSAYLAFVSVPVAAAQFALQWLERARKW